MKRKAQGAIEYLFMIAAALVIVLIVWKQITKNAQSAGNQAQALQNETIKKLNETVQNP